VEVRRVEADHEARCEALTQALFEAVELVRGSVGRHHELAAGVPQRVEGVEELLLGAGFVGQELDVVQEQHVDAAEALLERARVARLDRAHELGRELLDGRVTDGQAGAEAPDVVADGVQEVRLAEPGPAVDEERVVGLAGQLRDGERGGVGETVAAADDELLEGVLRIQARIGQLFAAARRGGGVRLGPPLLVDDLDDRVAVECGGSGGPDDGEIAVADPGADVVRRADEERLLLHGGQLEGLDPHVELEVGHFAAKFVADAVPDGLDLFAHRQS
jgi:hypothetical protein